MRNRFFERGFLSLAVAGVFFVTACDPPPAEDAGSNSSRDAGTQMDSSVQADAWVDDAAMPDAAGDDAGMMDAGGDDAATGDAATPNTIVDVAVAAGTFTTLVGALQSTGLDEVLAGSGPFTVFAPTDSAFALLPAGLVAGLDSATLSAVLQYHVVADEVTAAEVVGLSTATTVQGGSLDIAVLGGTVVLDGRVQVTQTDIRADNGIIHVIDAVLLPGDFPGTVVDALAASPRFSTLVGAVTGAGLASALSGAAALTVFAPSNPAFALLPPGLVASLDTATLTAVLQHHVLGASVDAATALTVAAGNDPVVDTLLTDNPLTLGLDGNALYLNARSQVVYTDIRTSNGIIHVLDSVLVPGPFPGDNVQALSAYPRFSSLVGAVASAGLASTLADGSGAGFTIFAPTNAAFAQVDLSGLNTTQLTEVLTYHVIGGEVDAATVVTLPSARTVEGSAIAIEVDGGVLLNGSSRVIWTDLETQNGLIHVIDRVLSPRTTVVDLAVAAGDFETLAGALTSTGLNAALDGAGPFTVFAPTDAAFALLPAGLLAGLTTQQLSDILLYHVLGEEKLAASVVQAASATTLHGGSIDIAVRGSRVVLDGRVQVTQTDLLADNGVIHVVDAVLIDGDFPGTVVDALVASPRFSTLVGAVVGANLAGALATAPALTVFAPTDDGFARLPAGLVAGLDTPTLTAILQYHVLGSAVDAAGAIALAGTADPNVATLQGGRINVQVDGTVVINGRAQVEYADIGASNGVIHVLDSVYLPVDFPGTVVEALAAYPRFDTLVAAVAGQNLASTLSDTSGAGFTVFAPTNSAFAPLDLSGLSAQQLTDTLLYHVLASPVPAATVITLTSATTVQGSAIAIDASDGVRLNSAVDVTYVDFRASNGIIHVLDGVLMIP